MDELVCAVPLAQHVQLLGAPRVQRELLEERRANAGHPDGIGGHGAAESLESVVHRVDDQADRVDQRAVEVEQDGAEWAWHR